MPSINPYLNFNGKTEEAFLLYRHVFGNEFAVFQRFKETAEADKLPPADLNKIMHVALPIGKGTTLMGTDILESMGQKLVAGNNFYISIEPDSKEEADRLFSELSEGGKVEMPLQDTFWGAYFGSFADKFGVQWMINFVSQDKKP